MTRFVVDASAAIELASTESGDRARARAAGAHPVALADAFAVARGPAARRAPRRRGARAPRPHRAHAHPAPRRCRAAARAWELADRLGWASTYDAEYLALTQLQADAFVTMDAELARQAAAVVKTAPIEALR